MAFDLYDCLHAIRHFLVLAIIASLAVGCAGQNDILRLQVHDGDLADARRELLAHPNTDKKNTEYFLQNLRTFIVTLADGYTVPGDPKVQEIFDTLRHPGNQRRQDS